MGKYMKKSKVMRGDIAVMDGVRTRAKTLALQRLNIDVLDEISSLGYLQLRNRRLEKSLPLKNSCRAGDNGKRNQNQKQIKGFDESLKEMEIATSIEEVVGLEASYGDNILDFESRDRSTSESAPCSLISGCDIFGTPSSPPKRTSSTSQEIEEFFASVEKQQHILFVEKYNFDIVNDLPLPGHYEWVQVVP